MNKQWLSATLFLAVIAGGTLAFLAVEDGWTVLDALYMTVISVTTVGYGEVHALSSAGRVVAMAVLFCGLGIIGLALSQITAFVVGGELAGVFERNRLRKRAAALRGHVIVCGLGKRGTWIVDRLAEASPCDVTAIELDASVPAIASIRRSGVPVVVGNARDRANLHDLGLASASRVVVVAGRDEENLAIAKEVQAISSALPSPPAIIAAVERYDARSYFTDRMGAMGVSLLGFRAQAALWLAHDLMLEWVDTLGEIPSRPVRVFAQASDEFRDEIVRAFAMACQLTGEARPQLRLFQASPAAESQFLDSFPAASLCADVSWRQESMEAAADDGPAPDIAIFAMASDIESLYAAERYLMRRLTMAPEQVIACIQDTGDLRDAALRPDPYKRQPRVLGFYEARGHADPILSPAMDAEGRRLHDTYRLAAAKENRDPGPWEQLPEFLRNSNRLAAMHQPLKRRLYERLVARGANNQQHLLTHLAVSEHARWVAFHVMHGWRPSAAPIADRAARSQARLHHAFVPFEALDMATRAYDLANVLQALDLDMNTKVSGINA